MHSAADWMAGDRDDRASAASTARSEPRTAPGHSDSALLVDRRRVVSGWFVRRAPPACLCLLPAPPPCADPSLLAHEASSDIGSHRNRKVLNEDCKWKTREGTADLAPAMCRAASPQMVSERTQGHTVKERNAAELDPMPQTCAPPLRRSPPARPVTVQIATRPSQRAVCTLQDHGTTGSAHPRNAVSSPHCLLDVATSIACLTR